MATRFGSVITQELRMEMKRGQNNCIGCDDPRKNQLFCVECSFLFFSYSPPSISMSPPTFSKVETLTVMVLAVRGVNKRIPASETRLKM